jgi:hypothetical protein
MNKDMCWRCGYWAVEIFLMEDRSVWCVVGVCRL